MPFICAYLIWLIRSKLPPLRSNPRVRTVYIATALLSGYILNTNSTALGAISPQNFAALTGTLLVVSVVALCYCETGALFIRSLAFPLGFFAFIIPLPRPLEDGINLVLQLGSAKVGELLFRLAGTPVYASALSFRLPGISLQVAPECSGIHSSLTLVIVSILAGHLFLTSHSKRILLASVVIPLALLRNGFRIFVIGELCVHRGADMINSDIHRHGGPLFFLLSLVPLTVIAWILFRSERSVAQATFAR